MRNMNPALVKALMHNWDAVVRTSDCRHCHGTGRVLQAPNSPCGFCDDVHYEVIVVDGRFTPRPD